MDALVLSIVIYTLAGTLLALIEAVRALANNLEHQARKRSWSERIDPAKQVLKEWLDYVGRGGAAGFVASNLVWTVGASIASFASWGQVVGLGASIGTALGQLAHMVKFVWQRTANASAPGTAAPRQVRVLFVVMMLAVPVSSVLGDVLGDIVR
ncbi:hypothetical protein [Amycolatopsis minnesotensis]|uniref:Uncharacterized protein n=1 Tax=Amycolatopsis minnesotensis TaxID=337894 RepID=A0ABN2Q0Y8_9PSEU